MWLLQIGVVQFYDADGNMLLTVNLLEEWSRNAWRVSLRATLLRPSGGYNSIARLADGADPVLRILKYPHPALRHKSKPLRLG